MPAPVVLVLSDRFTAFGGQTSSTAYVVSNILSTAGCTVHCTSTIPAGLHDDYPEELRGDIHLVRATPGHNPDGEPTKPETEWISKDYKKHFPTLSRPPEEASHIIGIVPTTAQTAFNIAQSWWIDHKIKVKVMLFIPTKISDPEVSDKILNWAYRADTVFSVGPKLKEYYSEIFSARKDIDPHKHRLFAYHPRCLEKEDRPPGPFEIVSFYTLGASSELNSEAKKDFKLAAKALSHVESFSEAFPGIPPQWSLYTDHEALDEKSLAKENFHFQKRPPAQTKEELNDHLFACSAVLSPETDSHGFNFEAWEAMGAGHPVLVTARSGLGLLLRHEEVMNLYSSRSVVYMQGHSEIFKDFFVQHFVKRPDLALENAKLLAQALKENDFLARTEAYFVETFTKGTVLDEELAQHLARRQSSQELRSVNKLVKLCEKHQKELGLFCRKCKTPICMVCVEDHQEHRSDITHLSNFYQYFYKYTEMKTEKPVLKLDAATASAIGDTTKEMRMRIADCDTVRATIGVYKHALDNAISKLGDEEKENRTRLNNIKKHVERITQEYEDSIKDLTEAEKHKLEKFSQHVDEIIKEILSLKESGTEILDRQSDQTRVHNALQYLEKFEITMTDIFNKLKVIQFWKSTAMKSLSTDDEVKENVERLIGKAETIEIQLPLPKLDETQMKIVTDIYDLIEKPPEIIVEENEEEAETPDSPQSPQSPVTENGIDGLAEKATANGDEDEPDAPKKDKEKKKKKKAKKEKKEKEDDDEKLRKFQKKSRTHRRMSYAL